MSQIFDDNSKKLHKQTDRELEGTRSSLLNVSQVEKVKNVNTPSKFDQKTPDKGHKRSHAFMHSGSDSKK